MRKVEDDDYLDLWKYFQERADNVKEAMFNSATWCIGFAGAIFGFIITTTIDPTNLIVTNPAAAYVAAVVGLILCAYSLILVWESRKHIRDNWSRADHCRDNVEGLKAIIEAVPPKKSCARFRPQVWTQVLGIVALFAMGFVALIVRAWISSPT